MNIFEQFGIKEVTDVTLYSIHKKEDGSGDLYYMPSLFLDTLKISTYEQTAENTWAQGGIGNSKLICWDFNKEINISLQDALCTPAHLSLCWGGILSSNWKNGEVKIKSTFDQEVDRIARLQKACFPRPDGKKKDIGYLLPKLTTDRFEDGLELLQKSSIVDGTIIAGHGISHGHNYNWRLAIESGVKSVAQIPDRFFDVTGRQFNIDINRKVSVFNLESPTYANYKDAIIYKINTIEKAPPIAKIIFDGEIESKGYTEEIQLEPLILEKPQTVTLAKILKENGFFINDKLALIKDEEIFLSYEKLDKKINCVRQSNGTYRYSYCGDTILLYHVVDNEIKNRLSSNLEFELKTLEKVLVTYNENYATTDLVKQLKFDHFGCVEEVKESIQTCEADYLSIIVDNDNNYKALVGKKIKIEQDGGVSEKVVWFRPKVPIDTSLFKGLDMWVRFQNLNELIYFLLTKYERDIIRIEPIKLATTNKTWSVDREKTLALINEDKESRKKKGELWCYLNPKTLTPYPDDYWFHQGEIYYIKSLTLAARDKKLNAKKISIKADQFPGMYMLRGETCIRDRETGLDKKLQLTIYSCKVKSNQSLNLEAGGEPVVFNLELEVAKPENGSMMEILEYEVKEKIDLFNNALDGSSEIISE